MEKTDAARLGIADEDRRSYIRVSNDKANRAPAEQGDWFRLVPIRLANGGPEGGDNVGLIERWTPPEITAIFKEAARAKIQAEIASSVWRAHLAATDWAGNAVAKAIGVDIAFPADKTRVAALLKDMLAKGQLRIERRPDASRHPRDFIVLGEPVTESCESPAW